MTAFERLKQDYKDNPDIIKLSGEALGEKYGVSEGMGRRLKRQFKGDSHEPVISHKEKATITRKYREGQEEIERLKRELSAATKFKATPQVIKLHPPAKAKSFSTVVALASDWHCEETVEGKKVSGLNEFNLTIADKRIRHFFTNMCTLANYKAKETTIRTMVLGLLGDFVSGNIHNDIIESCSLKPTDAIMWVMQRIISGINYTLENTDFNLIIPCHSGNHARTTKEQYHANESGHSLEWMMYNFLNLHFEKNKRVQFMVADGYHTYLDINGFILRNHHGHAINYGGGVGGITIPAAKAIANWNKARTAHCDNFGHFHTGFYGGNFVSNSSLIGYSPYSVQIKAGFEKPSQTLYLINDKHKEITEMCKVFLSE
jgi:hypothetical protein